MYTPRASSQSLLIQVDCYVYPRWFQVDCYVYSSLVTMGDRLLSIIVVVVI